MSEKTCKVVGVSPGTHGHGLAWHLTLECGRDTVAMMTSVGDYNSPPPTEVPCDCGREELSVDECVRLLDIRWKCINWALLGDADISNHSTIWTVEASEKNAVTSHVIAKDASLTACLRAAVANVEGRK